MRERFMQARGLPWRAGIIVVVSLACLGAASSALAEEPTGDFAVFKQCPRFTMGVNVCLYSQIMGGETVIGKLSVPIVNPVTIQAGIIAEEIPPFGEKIVGALNGETLAPTPQPVPGGLPGLIDCNEVQGHFHKNIWRGACKAAFETRWVRSNPYLMAVSETTELAGPASKIYSNRDNSLNQQGIAFAIPVKIHLENPLLGRECYIGSDNNPIIYEFTTSTTNPPPPNKPISGKVGLLAFKDKEEFAENKEHAEVDNSFAAPEATGCGGNFAYLVNPLVNKKIGLPSPAGYNTIIHEGYSNLADVGAVIASEQETPPAEKGGQPGERRHERRWGHGPGPSPWRH